MRILVTGGAGFIGSNLVNALIDKHKVIVFDINSKRFDKDLIKKIEIIKGDIRKKEDLDKISQVDVVFHLAARLPSQWAKRDNIDDLGTRNLISWCRRNKVKKIIYSSSAAVYGEPRYTPVKETHPTLPISFYGRFKLSGEHYVSQFPSHIILRYANVYGKGGSGIVSAFLEEIKKEKEIRIFGSGEQTRDFINIKDVIQANLLALSYNGKEKIFNVGSGKEVSVNQLIEIFRELEPTIRVKYLPEKPGNIYKSWFDISKINNEMGFEPKIDLREGIKEMMR